jgi:hypothetical protein
MLLFLLSSCSSRETRIAYLHLICDLMAPALSQATPEPLCLRTPTCGSDLCHSRMRATLTCALLCALFLLSSRMARELLAPHSFQNRSCSSHPGGGVLRTLLCSLAIVTYCRFVIVCQAYMARLALILSLVLLSE